MATMLRQSQLVVEALVENTPKLRVSQETPEALVANDPKLRVYQLATESVTGGTQAPVRLYQVVIEAIYTEQEGTSYELSLTIAGTASMTLTPGTAWPQTLTIDGTAAVTVLDGLRYQETATIAATAALAGADSLGVNASLTISGTADIDVDFLHGLGPEITIGATADVDVAFDVSVLLSLTIAATAAFDSPGGVVYYIQRSIEGTSALSVLDGFSYERSLQIDATADITQDYIYIMEHYLTIAATADFTTDSQYGVNADLTIAGTADLDINDVGEWYEALVIAASGTVFVENVYDLLYVTAVIAGFDCSVTKTAPGDQNPGAIGSFSASALCVFNRPLTQTLVMVQTVVLKKPTWFVQQSLSFTQSVVVQKIHTKELTHTLSMTHEAIAVRSILQSLTFTGTAEAQKVITRSVTQTLTMTDSVARNTVVNQSLSDTLVFNPPNLERLPIFGSQNQTGNRQFEYYVPNVYAILVPRQCLIILGVPAQTVVLPCPIWGDGQSYQGTIDLKRSMTGVRYTYVKKTRTQKLNYSFELWTYKYLELRQFFIDHAEEVMTLQNHNSETWLVHLVNNPLEFTNESRWQPKGEKYNVTLEFEGVKLSG